MADKNGEALYRFARQRQARVKLERGKPHVGLPSNRRAGGKCMEKDITFHPMQIELPRFAPLRHGSARERKGRREGRLEKRGGRLEMDPCPATHGQQPIGGQKRRNADVIGYDASGEEGRTGYQEERNADGSGREVSQDTKEGFRQAERVRRRHRQTLIDVGTFSVWTDPMHIANASPTTDTEIGPCGSASQVSILQSTCQRRVEWPTIVTNIKKERDM